MASFDELLDRLIEQRAVATAGFRDFCDKVAAEKRDFTGEEHTEYMRRSAELDDMDTRINEARKRVQGDQQVTEYQAQAEQRLHQQIPAGQGGNPMAQQERDFLAFIKGESRSNYFDVSLAGLTVERDQRTGKNIAVESRSLVDGTYASGGALIPVSFRQVLYQHLILNSAVRQTRATILTTDSGESYILPKTTAHPANATIVAEGAALNEQDPSFGAATLSAYKYGNLVQISTELLQDTGVDLLGYLAMAMGRAIGIGAGADYVKGSGTSKPQGFLVGASTVAQVTGTTGVAGVPTYAKLEALYDAIIPPYQAQGEFIMSQKTVSALRSITDTLGRPLWVPSLSGAMPDTLLGHPFYIDASSGMPDVATSATCIAWGDFSTYFIRDVAGLRFERSNEYAFNTDMVTFRAILRSDGRLLDNTGAIGTYVGAAT